MNETTQQLTALRIALELAGQPMFVVESASQRIVVANPAACAVLDCASEWLLGRQWNAVADAFPQIKLRTVGGDARWSIIAAHQAAANQTDRAPVAHDVLTGLPGRAALASLLEREQRGDCSTRLAVLFIDLDDFKLVNDTHGHVIGDRVLRAVAERLDESVRPSDLVVRYGGDEFLVVVEEVNRRRDLERLARRIQRGVRMPILVEGCEFVLSASVGIAHRTARGTLIEALIVEADRAMYRAKSQHRAESLARHDTSVVHGMRQPHLTVVPRRRPSSRSATA